MDRTRAQAAKGRELARKNAKLDMNLRELDSIHAMLNDANNNAAEIAAISTAYYLGLARGAKAAAPAAV